MTQLCRSSLLATLLVAAYVRASNLHLRVWATPNGVRFQPWRPYIKLSYSACAMRAIESWSLSLCSVAAGWLPNPQASLAAMAGGCTGWAHACISWRSSNVRVKVCNCLP